MARPDDDTLRELEDFFYRRGKFAGVMLAGGPVSTYPGTEDGGLHSACEELECRGRLKRKVLSPDQHIWTIVDGN
jgi:hypothetical protein